MSSESNCLSLCLSVYLSVSLSVCLSVYLSVYLSVHQMNNGVSSSLKKLWCFVGGVLQDNLSVKLPTVTSCKAYVSSVSPSPERMTKTRNSSQFTLSTQLIKLSFPVYPSARQSVRLLESEQVCTAVNHKVNQTAAH